MKLSRLFVYPVKSLAGTEVSSWPVDAFGLARDRRWLVVGADGNALTQRELPRMALVRPTLQDGALKMEAPGMPEIIVADPPTGARHDVTVWDDTVEAVDAGTAAATWLTTFLHLDAHLVHMPESSFRRVHPDYSPARRRVSFADAFPFLIISQESLDELNRRLPNPMGMERFRPNIVVSGAAEAHAEDDWRTVQIGEVEFALVKPCARCAVPTIDPLTAERGKEPTRTLATYRKRGSHVYFGMNAIHNNTGVLHVGAAATVASAHTPVVHAL